MSQGGFWPNMHLVVRNRLSPSEAARVLRQRIREIDPHLPVFDIAPMRERVEDSSRQAQLQTGLLAGFGLVALTLGALGVTRSSLSSCAVEPAKSRFARRLALPPCELCQ